jgi:two-component system, NtrC family, response regulator AtoC
MDSPTAIQSLVDLYDEPFVVIDGRLRVRLVNRAFEEGYGVAREQAVGRHCYQVFPGTGPGIRSWEPDSARPYCENVEAGMDEVRTGPCVGPHQERIQGQPLGADAGGPLLGTSTAASGPPEAEWGDPGPRMVGVSAPFRQVLARLRLAAGSTAPVLLEGATGTGKELAADYIHRHSVRAAGPLVTLDCTTLREDLFDSEVFGQEGGSVTGPTSERPGLIERAHGGTLFLDQIGELPPSLQAKLLRALESGEFRRAGGGRTRRADLRIVCASNRDLRGHPAFRQDLYYRIACMRIRLPSLAERSDDIPVLARELLARIGASANRHFDLDPAALALLQGHPFPGNVRELRNLLWVAALLGDGGRIDASRLAVALQTDAGVGVAAQAPQVRAQVRPSPAASPLTLQDLERRHVRDLLARHGGNRRAVAAVLKVSERTLYRKLKRYGLS